MFRITFSCEIVKLIYSTTKLLKMKKMYLEQLGYMYTLKKIKRIKTYCLELMLSIYVFVYALISFTNLKIVSPVTFVNTSYKLLTL